MPQRPLLIAAGGVFGVLIRWVAIELLTSHPSTVILGLNIVGSLVIGFLAGKDLIRESLWSFGAIGFCGGLTTFSSFAVDIATRLDSGDSGGAASFLLLTVFLAVVAAGAGYQLGARSRPSKTLTTSATITSTNSKAATGTSSKEQR